MATPIALDSSHLPDGYVRLPQEEILRLAREQVNPIMATADVDVPRVDLARYAKERGRILLGGTPSADVLRDCQVVVDAYEGVGLLMPRPPERDLPFGWGRDRLVQEFDAYLGWVYSLPVEEKERLMHRLRQNGWWEPFFEKSRQPSEELLAQIPRQYRPALRGLTLGDFKERFFLPPGAPTDLRWFHDLNPGKCIPNHPDCPLHWELVTDALRNDLLHTVRLTLEMYCIGHGVSPTLITALMDGAPHMLAATGSDLTHVQLGQVLFGFHYDFNLITGHASSGCPALHAWTRDWQRFAVSLLEGHYLLQASKQFWWLTGGRVHYGYHEGIVTDATLARAAQWRAEHRLMYRISKTLFACVASCRLMRVLPPWLNEPAASSIGRIYAGTYSRNELAGIGVD